MRVFFKIICIHLFINVCHYVIAEGKPSVKVQVHEHRISEQSDTEYVRKIMCLSKSAEMRNYMRYEVDACDNFYEYACGNWAQIYPAASSEKRKTSFHDLLEISYKQKQSRLLKEEKREQDTLAIRKMKDFFRSCTQLKRKSKETLREELREILIEFGLMLSLWEEEETEQETEQVQMNNNVNETEFDWLEAIGKIQQLYGLNVILQMRIINDFDNATLQAILVGPPSELKLGNKNVYLGVATTAWQRKEYQNQIKNNLENLLGLPETKAEEISAEILDFEIALAKGLPELKTAKLLRSEAVKRTPEDLEKLYMPELDLMKFVNTALGYKLNVSFYEYLTVYQENLLKVLSDTTALKLANYILYKLAEEFFMDSDTALVDREELCLIKSKLYFTSLLDKAVYQRYNMPQMPEDIENMWQSIKGIFKKQLETDSLAWLSPLTRKLAIEKLDTMQLTINSYEDRNFSLIYKDLLVNDLDYVQNVKAILSHRVKYIKDEPLYHHHHNDYYLPFYKHSENSIVLPVSLLQPNYIWSNLYPQALKFGTLGFLLARELIYGFDDLLPMQSNDSTFWLDETSAKAFQQRKKCFKSQYARYRYNGKYLPETDLQQDNIADNGGVQIAFQAYNDWLSEHSQDTLQESLPHMHFNSEQLFFLGFAQFFCNDADEIFKEKIALLDIRPPEIYRVIGSLANFAEFSNKFHCQVNSTLNPSNKCQMF
uniref:Peptidase M13 N-terminal domain-containing protein n=1 Tax=Glossina brevipalpis TaxID=37001 RepID=A0A1A9W6K1_9MUSC